ncbi:MAG: PilZ domain-containing protein [Syntrophobacteraceae bacterium]|nr:PilZ domain-containing protein [Syntrophobacteraceae bacterium]
MDKEKLFNGLLAEVGRPLNLCVGEHAIRGFFVGFKPREYLIIDVPKSGEVSDSINGADTAVGTFCASGSVLQFESPIVDFIQSSAWLLMVAYPRKIAEIHNLRQSYRAECTFPCRLVTASDLKEYSGLMADVSSGGCRCTLPSTQPGHARMFNLESKVLLEFKLPGNSGKKGLLGEILHVERHGSEIALGIKFCNDNDMETMEELGEYISIMMTAVPS